MTENYFLYIVPFLPSVNDLKNNPEEFGWKNIGGLSNSTYSNPYTDYIDYNKKINYNNYIWSIKFRKYQKLNSALFVIKCSDTTYKAENFIEGDELFIRIKNECGVFGAPLVKKYILKFFKDNEGLKNEKKKLSYLFTEINEKNEVHRVNESCFHLKINFDDKLTERIKDNIFTLLSLSDIAHIMEHEFLKNKHINQVDIINAFWSFKFLLFKCPGTQKFPLFFKNNMLVINNLLDYRNMDLIENQNSLIETQNILVDNQSKAVETQTKLLKEIHLVDNGILYLTLFIIFDVVYNIFSEIIGPIGTYMNLEIGHLSGIGISLISALAISFGVSKYIKK